MDSVVVEEPVETPEQTAEFADIGKEAPTVQEEKPQEQVNEVPDKFKGKSVEEIVSSYENLEKELGRKCSKGKSEKFKKSPNLAVV